MRTCVYLGLFALTAATVASAADAAHAQTVLATASAATPAPALYWLSGYGFGAGPYTIDFGDPFACLGEETATVTSLAAPIDHVYRARGAFRPSITDAAGTTRGTATPITLTGNAAPYLAATPAATALIAGDTATLRLVASDGDGSTRRCWVDWGDGSGLVLLGTTGCPASASHTYTAGGTFRATVQVQDNVGACQRARAELAVLSAADWTYLGPGAAGNFTDLAIHPDDPAILLAASDVAGVFLSTDGGATWQSVAQDFLAPNIFAVRFASETSGTVAYAATGRAIYKSAPDDFTTWRMMEYGMDDASPDGRAFDHPTGSIAVDPTNPDILWAGIGEPIARELPETSALWHVYKSTTGGEAWTGSLSLPDLDGDATTGEGTVYDIVVDPEDGDAVWVATSVGLYHTSDGGSTWTRMGVEDPPVTSDGGLTWVSSGAAGCASIPATGAALDATTQYCLPLTTTDAAYAPYALVTDLELVRIGDTRMLVANIQDLGNTGGAGDSCTDDRENFHDKTLAYFRGGPWVSEDDGLSFRWALLDATSSPKSTSIRYRCSGTSYAKATNLFKLAVDPADADHLFTVAVGTSTQGVYELDATTLTSLWCGDGSCEEGGVNSFAVPTNLTVANWDLAHPSLYVMHSFGIASLDWVDDAYFFTHLDADPTAADDTTADHAKTWTSTGLDDTIVLRTAISPDDAQVLFIGAGDAGIFRSLDGGASWANVSRYWASDISADVKHNNSAAVAFDVAPAPPGGSRAVYAATSEQAKTSPYLHVYRTGDLGLTWELIGTTDTTLAATAGAIDVSDGEATDLVTYQTSTGRHGVVVGTTQDGLFDAVPGAIGSPGATTWTVTSGAGCPTVGGTYTRSETSTSATLTAVNVARVKTTSQIPDLVFFAASLTWSAVDAGGATSTGKEARLYAYQPDAGTCIAFPNLLTATKVGKTGTSTHAFAGIDGFDLRVTRNSLRFVMGVDWNGATDVVEGRVSLGPTPAAAYPASLVETGAGALTWSLAFDLASRVSADAAEICAATYGSACTAELLLAFEAKLGGVYPAMHLPAVQFVPGPGLEDAIIAPVLANSSMDYYQPLHVYVRVAAGGTFVPWDAYDSGTVPVKIARDLVVSPAKDTLYWSGSGGVFKTPLAVVPR